MYLQVKFAFERRFSFDDPVCGSGDAYRVAVLDERNWCGTAGAGRDFSGEIQILAGLREGEQVVVHPGDACRRSGSCSRSRCR
jgi:hypothetical protein